MFATHMLTKLKVVSMAKIKVQGMPFVAIGKDALSCPYPIAEGQLGLQLLCFLCVSLLMH